MVTIDYIILGMIVVSGVIGLFRGFFPELLSLLSWVFAIWSGWNFASLITPFLDGKLHSPVLELWVARAIVLILVLLIGGLLTQLVSIVIKKTGLTSTDRSLGFVFGLARGVMILGVFVLFAEMMQMTSERWWDESRLIAHGETVAGWLHQVLPDEVLQRIPDADVQTDVPKAAE